MRSVGNAVALVTALSLLVACGGNVQSTGSSVSGGGGAAPGVLKIGVIAPLSGPGQSWGVSQKGNIELAADEINDKGGLEIGGKKYTLKVITYDDEYNAAKGVTVTKRLIDEDGVKVVFGSTGGNVSLAIQPLMQQNEIVSIADGYSDVLNKENFYTFRPMPAPTVFGAAAAKWMKKEFASAKKVIVVGPNDEGGWGTSKPLLTGYQGAGFDSSTQFYERGTQDFAPFITKLLSQSPDIIDTDGTPPGDAGLMVKTARQLGYKGQFTRLGGPGFNEIKEVAGADALEGFMYYEPFDTASPGYKALEKRFTDKYKVPMNEIGPYWYIGAQMVFKALQAAGTVTDTKKMVEALQKTSIQSDLLGSTPVTWGGKSIYGVDRELLTPIFIAKVTKGKPSIYTTLPTAS